MAAGSRSSRYTPCPSTASPSPPLASSPPGSAPVGLLGWIPTPPQRPSPRSHPPPPPPHDPCCTSPGWRRDPEFLNRFFNISPIEGHIYSLQQKIFAL